MTIVTCGACGLQQWVPTSGACRRCKTSLGFSIVEIPVDHNRALAQPDPPELALGIELRGLRLRYGKSQASIARTAHTSRTHVSRIESGAMPNFSTLLRLLRALGVKSLYLRLDDSAARRGK
jgi:DNA-binding phage protein